MNRIDICDFSGTDDAIDAKIALWAGAPAYADRLVGHLNMHRVGICLGVNGDCLDIQFLGSANDAYRNLPSIGYQDFFKHIDETGPGPWLVVQPNVNLVT